MSNGEDACVRGWKHMVFAISEAMGDEIDERTIRRWATRNKDPLPVYYDARGPIVYLSAVSEWLKRQVLPYQTHLREKRVNATRQHASNRAKRRTDTPA